MENNNMMQYVFPPRDAANPDALDFHITALRDGARVLLIDVAYQLQAAQLREQLRAALLHPAVIVLSHYHPDHFKGTAAFPDCELWASPHYRHNRALYQQRRPEGHFPQPTRLLVNGERRQWGDFTLRFHHTPGHSRCSLTTLINDEIAHVGDLLMRDRQGRQTLPRVEDFPQLLASLTWLRSLDLRGMLFAHGQPLASPEEIVQYLDDALYYTRRVWESRGALPLSACLPRPEEHYGRLELHAHNLAQLEAAP